MRNRIAKFAALLYASTVLLAPGLALAQTPPATNFNSPDTSNAINAGNPNYAGGMRCDGATDDTAAFQAAINAGDMNHGNRRVLIPGGDCKHTGVTVHAPVHILCAGRDATKLDLISGSAVPNILVAITAADVPGNGATFNYTTIEDCGITGNRADSANVGTAHGVAVKGMASPSSNTEVVELVRDNILNVAGDCLHYDQTGGGSWKGNFKANGTTCGSPGGNGISCNSSFDWQWMWGQIWGAGNHNVNFAACFNMRLYGVNMFSATNADISLFNAEIYCTSCVIDTTGTNGVQINNTGPVAGIMPTADFTMSYFRLPGGSATNTYSNIRFLATNIGNVYCANCRFGDPAIANGNGNTALDAIHFVAGNTGNFYADGATRVDAHDMLSAAATNSPGNIFWATGQTQFPRNMAILSQTQFDGFAVVSGANTAAKMLGTTAANDSGAVTLSTAGTTHANMTTNGTSFQPNVVSSPSTMTVNQGEIGLQKITPSGTAPGAGGLKLSAVAGTTGGTCKIIAYAGTSTTPVVIADNIGSGC